MTADFPEDWEPFVKALIEDARGNESKTREMLCFLAKLIERGRLPSSGRAFVAKFLTTIAYGGNPVPPGKKARGRYSNLRILAAVEQLRAKDTSPKDAHDRVGTQMKMKGSTVAKCASQGRQQIRQAVERNVRAGANRGKIIGMISDIYGIPAPIIRSYFF